MAEIRPKQKYPSHPIPHSGMKLFPQINGFKVMVKTSECKQFSGTPCKIWMTLLINYCKSKYVILAVLIPLLWVRFF